MVLSHFLRPESGLHIRKNGFSTAMRWLSVSATHPDTESDTEITTQLKRTTSKELRAEKVESFVRKYMESNSGNFPKPSHIQKEVGGSYYTVKEILSTLKEKTLGKQPGNDQNPYLPTPIVNPLASGLEQNSQFDIRPDADVNSNKEQNNGNTSDNAVKESSLIPVAGKPDSDVTAVHVSSSSSELQGNGDQLEQEVIISKTDFPGDSQQISILSRMFRRETYDETAVESNKRLHSDVVPSGVFDSVEDKVSPASKLLTFHMSAPNESPRKLPGLFGPSRLDFSRSRSHSSEDENATQSEFVPNVAKLFTGMNTSVEDTRMSNDQAHDQGNTCVKSNHLIENFLDRIDERQEKEPKFFDINYLMGCIKQMPLPTPETDKTSKASFTPGAKPWNDLPEERKTSPRFNFVHTNNDVEGPSCNAPANSKTQDGKSTSPEYVSLKISEQPSLSSNGSNDAQNEDSGAFKAVVKFLVQHVRERDIHNVFRSFGDISSIEFAYVEGATFHHANVYFKTKEGLKNALQKHIVYIANNPVTVEATDVVVNDGTSKRIRIPDLIGDPKFPVSLGKNPTRTVMIRRLTHDISPSHVESALSLCGCKVTGFFLGSSKSVAYVELETEEAKERALAKHTIDVLGKKVMMYRIDVPRTTVIRIFHSTPRSEDFNKLYHSVGKVRFVRCRGTNITDVCYAFSEWPNMQNVLNRLNGAQVDGQPIVAQPATVIPPEILSVLWAQPDGRKHVVSTMQSLLQTVEEENIVQKSKIAHLIENFYGAER